MILPLYQKSKDIIILLLKIQFNLEDQKQFIPRVSIWFVV